jgi:hypothetical protein
MYIESAPGATGFPQSMKGSGAGMASGGPGAMMLVQGQQRGSEDVQIMGPDAPAPAAQAVVAAQIAQQNAAVHLSNQSDHEKKVAIGIAVAMALGLGFVIYKATR